MTLSEVQTNIIVPTSLSPPTSPIGAAPSLLTSHFVQALHDYLPSNAPTEETVSCLFFKKGYIIEVFNRDSSGWWDGQTDGIRGWFPSNYVGKIGKAVRHSSDFEDDYSTEQLEKWRQKIKTTIHDDGPSEDYAISLDYNTKLTSIQDRVELARAILNEDRHRSGTSDFRTPIEEITQRVSDLVDAYSAPLEFNIQLNVFQVVSSIRSILIDADIVNKESPLLKTYPELARQRKAVLDVLSQLVLKGKDIQNLSSSLSSSSSSSSSSHENLDFNEEKAMGQISCLADQLLNEVEIFDKLLTTLPRYSTATSESTVFTRPSSMFQNDTPRSSFSSLGHSSIISLNSFRQHITEVRHSSTSLVGKTAPTSNIEQTLKNVYAYQISIRDLIDHLFVTIETFLNDRTNVTDILEKTRKVVETIKDFLEIAEHVYSDVDTEHSQYSAIPKDPHLASLILTKESVYSTITNLVTAVRALTGPQDSESLKRDFEHLKSCCRNVVNATEECAACIHACLEEFTVQNKDNSSQAITTTTNTKSENANDTDRLYVLNALSRKAATLAILQQQHNCQFTKSAHIEQEDVDEREIENLEVGAPATTTTTNSPPTANDINKDNSPIVVDLSTESNKENKKEETSQSHYIKSSISHPSLRLNIPEIDLQEIPANSNNETLRRSSTLRPRASSVNTAHSLRNQLPPAPPPKTTLDAETDPADPLLTRSSVSQDNDTTNKASSLAPRDLFKSRRPRVLSISSILPSINKSKSERVTSTVSKPMLPENFRPRNTPLWRTMGEATTSIKDELPYASFKDCSFTDEEIIVNSEGDITGSTIEALVKKLTLHEKSPNHNFTRAFFYNFRLFTTPEVLVSLLRDRFSLQAPIELAFNNEQLALWTNRVLVPVRLRVYNVIKTWLEVYFNFDKDMVIEKPLLRFVTGEMSKALPAPAKRMVELIKKTFSSKGLTCDGRKFSYTDSQRIALHSKTYNGSLFSNWTASDDHHFDGSVDKPPPQPIITKSVRNTLKRAIHQDKLSLIHVHDIDPVELARQITVIESNLFCQIRYHEMIGQEFKKKIGTSSAVHVKAMIQRSTQITSWVSDTILKETDSKKRAQVLKYWIKVGDACLQLNNYNTLMAIRSALDSTSIARLKKTWDHLSSKYKAIWEPIYRATDSQRNFAEYRQRLKTTIAPCLPFLGVYLTDMTFTDDGNADHRMTPSGRKLINFDKYVKITRILNEIDQFQTGYRLQEVEEIQTYLAKTLETIEQDDEVFYDLSLKREPKEDSFDS